MKKSSIAILIGALAVLSLSAYTVAGFSTRYVEENIEFVRKVEWQDDGDYYYVKTNFDKEYNIPAKDTIIRVDTHHDAWLTFENTRFPLFGAELNKIKLTLVIKSWRGL